MDISMDIQLRLMDVYENHFRSGDESLRFWVLFRSQIFNVFDEKLSFFCLRHVFSLIFMCFLAGAGGRG
jgi:hypothetical protein